MSIPAIARVLLIFVLIVILIRKKFSLGNAFFLGSTALGLIFGMNPLKIAISMWHSLTQPKTMSLALIVSLILVLSHSLEQAGQLERMLVSFQNFIKSSRLRLAMFPALIGLLPMPGGAIFSAPMVKEIGKHLDIKPERLSYINYWFRHIWEYWWPLYPGVLLTTTLADLNIWLFVAFLFPITIVAVTAGYYPIRDCDWVEHYNGTLEAGEKKSWTSMLRLLLPIAIVIIGGLGLGFVLVHIFEDSGLHKISRETGLIVALICSILWVWHENSFGLQTRISILKRKQLIFMTYMIASILIFKGILEDSHAISAIGKELLRLNIPLVSITVLLPFLVGMVAGITIAFVGTTFPIIISLTNTFGVQNHIIAYMMLGLVSGFSGVLLSPLHLCLLLSNEYFNADLGAVYKYLLFPCGSLLLAGLGYFYTINYFLG